MSASEAGMYQIKTPAYAELLHAHHVLPKEKQNTKNILRQSRLDQI